MGHKMSFIQHLFVFAWTLSYIFPEEAGEIAHIGVTDGDGYFRDTHVCGVKVTQ